MVWTAVLLGLVLVLGRGAAYGEWRCDELTASRIAAKEIPEDRMSLRGFFVDPARPTRVVWRILDTNGYHECFLQHEDGPVSHRLGRWDSHIVDFVTACRDPLSGRDHAIVFKTGSGSGSISSKQYWSVHPPPSS